MQSAQHGHRMALVYDVCYDMNWTRQIW